MAKRRKMLGRADDPQIVILMKLIETQSKTTLATWAADCVEHRYLPIFEKAYPEDCRPADLLYTVREYLSGKQKISQLKEQRKQVQAIFLSAGEEHPAALAAARAIITACTVIQTPTNALGFVFYGAAAVAYETAGLTATMEEYQALAAAEFKALTASLKQIMVPEEPNPAKINWNC